MKRTHNILATLIVNDKEIEVEVNFNYYAGCRGARDAYGQPLEPDDPEDVEILSVLDLDSKDDVFEFLNDQQKDVLTIRCIESMQDLGND